MKIRDKMRGYLTERGLSEDEAEKIFQAYLGQDEIGRLIAQRLEEDESRYSKVFFQTIWIQLESRAIEWMNENQPDHPARDKFRLQGPDLGDEIASWL